MAITFLQIPFILPWIVIAILLTIIYSIPLWPFSFAKKLRRLGFLKTGLLAFTWSFVTTVLPSAGELPIFSVSVLLLLTARFFFMLMLCSIFDSRDIKMDKIHGLHSLATDVSVSTLKIIMLISFVGYMMAGLAVRQAITNSNQLLAFIITGCFVWWVYRLSLKKQGYNFYYFVVDGLMLLSAGFSFLASQIPVLPF